MSEEKDYSVLADMGEVILLQENRIKELETELAEAKKESAMYWNQVMQLNEKLAAFGLDEDFDDAAIASKE